MNEEDESRKQVPDVPDPDTDKRLKAPSLPDPPDVRFTRPVSRSSPPSASAPERLAAEQVRGMGLAMGIGTSLVASILSGALLGWAADKYLIRASTPYGLIAGFLLGVVAGFLSVARTAALLNAEPSPRSDAPKK